MDFGLSEEQQLLQQSLRGYLAERVPLERVRAVMESESGFDRSVVGGLAEQGVTGALVPESSGGSGLGMLEAAVIAEELGRAATPFSFHSAAVMAPLVIAACGSEAQQREWLAAIATGERVVTAIVGPGIEAGARLEGRADYVPDAAVADAFVVLSGSGSATTAHLVPRDTEGVRVNALEGIDLTRRLGQVTFERVKVDDPMRLAAGDAGECRGRVTQAGRIALAADALGAAERGLEAAVAYAMDRKQFDRSIASFQAVKHMCAETYAEIEPVRALLWYGAFAWDERNEDTAAVVAMLKAHAAEVGSRAVTTATQVFGGMGFTWECDMHLWFKRVGYDRQVLGGPAELRAEAAALRLA